MMELGCSVLVVLFLFVLYCEFMVGKPDTE